MINDSKRGNMQRTIQATGEPLEVHDAIHKLTVDTRVPSKYLLVDMETGQVYRGSTEQRWKKVPIKPNLLIALINHLFGKPDESNS